MNHKNRLNIISALILLFLFISGKAVGEGTKELSPTPADSAMLLTNSGGFGNFASYTSFGTDSSLNIRVSSVLDTIFIGLSGEANDFGTIDGSYFFRILDPTGAVAFGPFQITPTTDNADTWALAANGPDVLGMGGYSTNTAMFPYSRFVPTMIGDYVIQFDDGGPLSPANILWYDFTIRNSGEVKPGRLWSRNWAIRTPPIHSTTLPECQFDRAFNGVFYSYTMDGFVSRIDFDSSGFQGLSFTVSFGDRGPGNSGDVIADRRSVNGANATAFNAEHQIFLNDPDNIEFPSSTDQCGEVALLSVSCETPDSFCINIGVTQPGQVEIILDFVNNGIFDLDTTDVLLVLLFTEADTLCIPWNGLKGDGSSIDFGEEVPTVIRYSQGVQHYAAFDVELLKAGFCVQTIRPICAGVATDLLFWDDSQITDDVMTVTIDEGDPGTGQPKMQLNGCTCGVDSCRTWTTFQIGDPPAPDCTGTPFGYGDNSTLNTWWFASTIIIENISLPFAQVNISGDSLICAGDSTTFFANVFPDTVIYDFIWSGPGGFTANTQSSGFVDLAGIYFVTITDPITDCSASDSIELLINQPPITTIDFECLGGNQQNANVLLTVSGGLMPYTFLWSNGETTEDLFDVPPGQYSVIVTDANGCMAFDTILVQGCCDLVVTCPPANGGTFACADDVPTMDPAVVTVIQFCDGFTITSDESDNGGVGCPLDPLIITRIYTVEDSAGNIQACTQTFTVADNIAPNLLTALNDTSIICGDAITTDLLGIPSFGDNCSSAVVTFEDDSTGFDGTCTNDVLGVVIRTFFAEDDCGNINSAEVQQISIIDTIPPTFTAPPDVTIDCAADISPSNTGEVLDTLDNCSGLMNVSFSDLVVSGVCPVADTVFRTWTVSDECGNLATDLQVLLLLDTVPPTFTIPDTLLLDCGADIDPAVIGSITDVADNCSEFIITFSDLIVQDGCPVNDTVFRSWVVTDDCGNSSTGVQVILRLDQTAPTFTTPADTLLNCGLSTDTSFTGSITDATDNCSEVEISFTDEVVSGTCPGIDTTFRTWVVDDHCNNSSSAVQTIIRIDTLPPDITSCPADVTISCNDATDPQALGSATATDNCDSEVDVTFLDTPPGTGCSSETPVIRTWTATDNCGNTSTCAQTILVLDAIPPTFVTPIDVTINCDDDNSPQSTGSPTEVADDCSTPDVTFNDLVVDSDCSPFVDNILRTWIVTDFCGNSSTGIQTIFRIDTVPPTFTVPSMTTISCDQDSLPSITGDVTDTLDNCTFLTVSFSDLILPNGCPTQDTIERTWQVTDDCGNSSTAIQLILRLDEVAPTFTVPADTIVDCGGDTSPASTGDVTDATDNCSGVTITFEDVSAEGTCPILTVISRTWIVSDQCDNSATAIQNIMIQDTTPPAFIIPANITVDCDIDLNDLTLTGNVSEVTDCSSIQDTTYSDLIGIDGCDGTAVLFRTWVVTDLCDNSSSGVQDITVQDTLSPDITIPDNITIECDQDYQDTSITGGMIIFLDNCSLMFGASFTDDISGLTGCNGTGIVLRTWLIDDECDNASTMTQEITIADQTLPTAICQNITLDFGSLTSVTITPQDIDNGSFDNCGDVTLTLSDTTFTCAQFVGIPSLPVILTVTDECGNSSTCEAQVAGVGGLLTIDCPDDIIIYLEPTECTAFVTYEVTADAICGGSNVTIIQTDLSGLTSGDAFPIGITTQSYIATNGVDTVSCSFTITVFEADIPVVMACNDTIQVSVDANCDAHIFVSMVLSGTNYGCFNDFFIAVDSVGMDTGWITIADVPLNMCYMVTITDPETGNSCWGNICLEDKIPPQIICACPANDPEGDTCVISCLEVEQLVDGNIPPHLIPQVIENCDEYELTVESVDVDDEGCGEGIVTITWRVTDNGGLTATCAQVFNITPLSIDSIVYPPNYTGECGTSSDPDVTGWPQVNGFDLTDEVNLCNLFLGYWDKSLQDCGGGQKILRTWTVLDWCTLELVEATQIIKLSDEEGPVLTCPHNITVGTEFWYCYANLSVPKPQAHDECSDVVNFDLSVNGGTIVQFGNNFVVNGLLLGTYVAVWTVTDLCGNSSTCSFNITVVDNVVPVANCDQHTIVGLTNDGPSGITLVPASVLDDGSYDNCGPVTFRARRMDSCIDIDWTTEGACIDHIPGGVPAVNSRDRGTVHRPCVPFACCDVGAGPIMVELEVTDASGNVNYCMVEVTVQDKISPFIECPPDITVSCDFWFNVQEGTYVDEDGNHDGSLDEDPLSSVFGNMYDAFRYPESIRNSIIINDPGNEDVQQPHNWGLDGWADDNCQVNLQVRVRVIDDCSGGDLPPGAPVGAVKMIERRFSASDGNEGISPGTCTQRIWVVDFDRFYITDNTCQNNNPNDGVIWPCDVLITDCPDDYLNLGEPVVFDDACSLIGVTYEDTRFEFSDGACFKILRDWKIIDWCQYDPLTGYGLWSYTQVIKVHDDTAPVFLDCPSGPVTLCVADPGVRLPANNQAFLGETNPLASSCSAHVTLTQRIKESCNVQVSYEVKLYPHNGQEFIIVKPLTIIELDENHEADLVFDSEQSPNQVIRNNGIPYNSKFCGDYHRIVFSVEDGCGNWSHCDYLIRLEDCKQPSPVCIQGLSTVIMPLGCQVTLWAADFNASSFDDCTPGAELLYSFSGDNYQPSMVFDTFNIPAFGVELTINIWVADAGTDHDCNGVISWSERNKDFCTTTVVFTDNSDNCGNDGSIVFEGEILTPHEEAVELVNVSLNSNAHSIYNMSTIENGQYIVVVPQVDGQRYQIIPKRSDEHRNGVSTLDLVRIQKHLLGIELFDSPYQYIASDANNNEQVSAIDLVEIRKLILGIYHEFPANDSWRFVDKNSVIPDPTHPWPFEEMIQQQYDGTSQFNLDFIGVKIGDVNNTVKANAVQILPRGGRRILHVGAGADTKAEIGKIVNVSLVIPELIEGFQWTIETKGLKFVEVRSDDIHISNENVGVLNNGILTMSWNQMQVGKTSDKKDITVFLQFVATQSGEIKDMISISGKVTEAEAYTYDSEVLDVKLTHDQIQMQTEFALFQNEPNPWTGSTTISFNLPEAGLTKLTFFDMTGKMIKVIEGEYSSGQHSVVISKKDINAHGVLYYRLDVGNYSATKKMIRLE